MKGERRKKFNSVRQIRPQSGLWWPFWFHFRPPEKMYKKGGRQRALWDSFQDILERYWSRFVGGWLEPEAAGVLAPNIEHFGDRPYWNKKPLWSRSNFFSTSGTISPLNGCKKTASVIWIPWLLMFHGSLWAIAVNLKMAKSVKTEII